MIVICENSVVTFAAGDCVEGRRVSNISPRVGSTVVEQVFSPVSVNDWPKHETTISDELARSVRAIVALR